MKKVRFLLLLLMSFALMISACKKDDTGDPDPNPTPGTYSIAGYSQDAVSYAGMAGAMIVVTDALGTQLKQGVTDGSGNYLITGLNAGSYTVTVSKDGYHTQTANLVEIGNVNIPQQFVGFMPADLSITVPVGGLCGIVLNAAGAALANATVAISAEDESLTNGYFTTAMTDASGKFAIGAIPLEAGKGDLIPAFKVKVIQGNFIEVVHNVVISQNMLVVKNINLVNQNVPGNTIFSDGFEASSAWEYTGFWHSQANATIMNSNVTAQYVNLAPNDNTNGYIPSPYAGSYSAWYGEVTTGSFIGEAQEGQAIGSGGTGYNSNFGYMLSPQISLVGLSQASLSFWSWFEIESVNPNEYGFDIMEVFVVDVATSVETSLGRLNPYSDPILDDRAPLPFTSGGFNKAPIWNNVEYDLSEFAGADIKLKFEFRTVDALYNGFRGWFVDNILVTDKAPVKAANTTKVYGPDPKPRH